jgi:hypothetical protein
LKLWEEHGFLTTDVALAASCEFMVVPEMKVDINRILRN